MAVDWETTTSSPPGPNLIPDRSLKRASKPRILEARFGDGYGQRMRDGINQLDQSWSLSFNNRPITDIRLLQNFLESKGGVSAFTWIPPGFQGDITKTISASAGGIVQYASTKVQINTTTAHGLVNGTKVIISGANRSAVNGTWITEVIDSDSFTIYGLAWSSVASAGGGGTVYVPPIKVVCKSWDDEVLFTTTDLVTGYGSFNCTFERVYE
jgi:phage-related protein